jgi:hypothetical protein
MDLLSAQDAFRSNILPVTGTAVLRPKKATRGKTKENKTKSGEEKYGVGYFHGLVSKRK